MTVYRLIGPRGIFRGSIDEVLQIVAQDIDPIQFYWFDDREDITGAEVVRRLLELKDHAEPDHTYVQSVVFGRSVDGRPGDFRITRVEGADLKPPVVHD
jgi:hypothetical protein